MVPHALRSCVELAECGRTEAIAVGRELDSTDPYNPPLSFKRLVFIVHEHDLDGVRGVWLIRDCGSYPHKAADGQHCQGDLPNGAEQIFVELFMRGVYAGFVLCCLCCRAHCAPPSKPATCRGDA